MRTVLWLAEVMIHSYWKALQMHALVSFSILSPERMLLLWFLPSQMAVTGQVQTVSGCHASCNWKSKNTPPEANSETVGSDN